MRKLFFFIVLSVSLMACLNEKQQAEMILRHYISQKEGLIRNYSMESSVALWNATVSGDENDYQKLVDIELAFNKSNQNSSNLFAPDKFSSINQNIFTNQQDFELLKKLKFSGLITDTLLSRQLNVLYQAFMGPQIETERYQKLMNAEVKLWQAFSVIKITLQGKKYGLNQIDSIKKNTKDALVLKDIFLEYQKQGRLLAPQIVRMVKERNEFAASFGYTDFYQLSLEAKDQTPEQIKIILDEVEEKTNAYFLEAKRVIDKMLAKRFHLPAGDLEPWLYNDERNSYLPERFTWKMDTLFSESNPVQKAEVFFESIGLPIHDVVKNSDLEYRIGKSSVTAMINVDFKNDIRLISSIQNTHEGMVRMMHLGGHASHYNSISDRIPYLLKTPNYALGEGIAKYFETLASDYGWLKNMVEVDTDMQKQLILVCQHLHQVDQLFRCRKQLVFANFEREIYQNPDQDLDDLWRRLNAKYLGVNYPVEKDAGFWAANKYATSLSCTIHSIVLADVFAAQLQHAIEDKVLAKTNGVYAGNKAIGMYLVTNLYRYGNLMPWEQLIEKATGEPLTTKYFVDQLIDEGINMKK